MGNIVNIVKDKLNIEKLSLRAGAVLFLLGFLVFASYEVSAQRDPCDFQEYNVASSNVAPLLDENKEGFGWGNFDILRNGEAYLYVDVGLPDPLPKNTVLKVFLNGVELGTMERYIYRGQEYWYWGPVDGSPVARVGDAMSITKDGQPFLSGVFIRYVYSWAYIDSFATHQIKFRRLCSTADGYIYFPNSQYPGRLLLYPSVYTNSPVTRITLNEPSLDPGRIGPEIANIAITRVGVIGNPLPPDWRNTRGKNEDIRLTEIQYEQLRQGRLTVNVFTETNPFGFSQIPLRVFYINATSDFEGDGRADFAVFRPSETIWYLLYSSNNQFQALQFGSPNDKLVPGDYDHDGKADVTNFQVDNPEYQGLGLWKILKSSDNSTSTIQWGLSDDIPLSMDIDGNNASDLAVFRPSNGTWYVKRMGDIIKPLNSAPENASLNYRIIQWGAAGDKPIAGDFDGDGVDELVAFRPSEGNWYIYNNITNSYRILRWGLSGDIPMAKDFDGDAKVDVAVYRPSEGTWYLLSSLDNSLIVRQFGLSEDIPVPADFDKDGASDIAVYRPSNGTWYVTRSSDNSFFAAQFGSNGDIPVFGQE